jgi:hypothetical protein
VFRTVREQFLVELEVRGGARDLEELNRLFGAWVEGVDHHRVHSETGQTPMERFLAGAPPRLPSPAELREAFLWAEHRQVTKQAMVSLFGNRYQSTPPGRRDRGAGGRPLRPRHDPVRYQQPHGAAVPFQRGRHVHPHATSETDPARIAPRPSGIDYLAMLEQRIATTQRRRIADAALPAPTLQTLQPPPRIMPPPVTPVPATPPRPSRWASGCTRPPPSRRIRQAMKQPAAHHAAPHRHRTRRHRGGSVVIERLRAHYGFGRTPFGRDLAPRCSTSTTATPRPSPPSPG